MSKTIKKEFIKIGAFLSMLKQVNLGGILEECVLVIKNGKAKIEAVDITNSLIVICKKPIMPKDTNITFGLGNLDILIKFLSTLGDSKLYFKCTSTIFKLTKVGGRRKLDYLLTQPDLIATQLQAEGSEKQDDPYKKMKKMMDLTIDLTASFIKDFLSYINLLKTKDVTLDFDEDDMKLTFICGGTNDHKFELELSTEVEGVDRDDADSFSIKVNGEHLARIFSTIDFDEDDPPTLSFTEDELIMVEDNNAAWALVPLTNLEEE